MNTVTLALPSISSADAIGNDVLAEYAVLESLGFNVHVFAEHYEPQFAPLVCPFEEARKAEMIIYHHGIHWSTGERLLKEHRGPIRILRYHNVTPPTFFEEYSSELANLVKQGRDQTERLVPICTHYVTDSAYNRDELITLGASPARCWVVPIFHQTEALLSSHADIRLLETLIRKPKARVLFVGRQAPNKGLHHLVRVVAIHQRLFGKRIQFFWIGAQDPGLSAYYRVVREDIKRYRLSDTIFFPGRIPVSELKSYYLSSHVFLSLSEHEGFCVPIVEAQALGVPVLAIKRAAIPDTAGKDQLLLEDLDYERFAVAIEVLLNNIDYRLYLSERGKENYRTRFTYDIVEAAFLVALREVLSA